MPEKGDVGEFLSGNGSGDAEEPRGSPFEVALGGAHSPTTRKACGEEIDNGGPEGFSNSAMPHTFEKQMQGGGRSQGGPLVERPGPRKSPRWAGATSESDQKEAQDHGRGGDSELLGRKKSRPVTPGSGPSEGGGDRGGGDRVEIGSENGPGSPTQVGDNPKEVGIGTSLSKLQEGVGGFSLGEETEGCGSDLRRNTGSRACERSVPDPPEWSELSDISGSSRGVKSQRSLVTVRKKRGRGNKGKGKDLQISDLGKCGQPVQENEELFCRLEFESRSAWRDEAEKTLEVADLLGLTCLMSKEMTQKRLEEELEREATS